MDRNDLFKKLFNRCNGFIELRALLSTEKPKIKFIHLNTDWETVKKEADKFCDDYKDQNLYFGAATRDGKGGKKKNVISIPCVWAEIDYKDILEAKVQEIIDKFPFKPTIITKSGGGVHLYFLLEKPVDLKRSNDVQKVNDWIRLELCKLGECKLDKVSDIPRVFRLPGTVNHKYNNKPLCEVIEINTNTYKLDDLLKNIPAPVTKPTRKDRTHIMAEISNSKTDTKFEAQVEYVTKQIEVKNIILGDDRYNNWRDIAFALADGLGERGRSYFHRVSSNSNKYDKEGCDKQYDACLNGSKPDDRITIATFFHYAKQVGIEVENFLQSIDIHNTDLGNSQRIINSFGDIIRYCGTWKKWLMWNDQYGAWQIDDSGKVLRLARKTIQNIFEEASGLDDSNERKKIVTWGLASESATRIQAMVKLAESGEGIAISPSDLDRNPWLLSCQNGTIDLRTGQLKEYDKSDLITKVIPVTFDSNAKCPKWLSFLDRIMAGNERLISFLQRAVGYTLTGDTREQCFFILHGCSANGKSVFIKTIGTLLGDYAQAASFETFLSKKQGNIANNDIARMQGKRFISAVEAEENRRLAENVIKQVTGKDVVAARFLYAEYFEFLPQFKIFLATNHKPKINCNDPAIWRRVKLVPFAVKIPEEEQVLDLGKQLEAELSGILNWAVDGCLEWQRNGLRTPEEVVIATQEYRNEMDTINEFLGECCTLLPNLKAKPTDLYTAYKRHCELNGESFLSMKEFGRSLNDKGYKTTRSHGNTWRLGIGLQAEEMDIEKPY